MIEPEGVKILVEPEKLEEKTEGGIYLAPQGLEREQMAVTKGKVLKIGPDAEVTFFDGPLKVNDTIIFAKYGGMVVKDNGDEYRVINDEDVIAKVEA